MSEPPEAQFRVVRGEPSADDLAALAALATALATARRAAIRAPDVRGGWADRAEALRRMPRPGPGAWRASAGD
jgi:hypothetical protein